MLINGSEAARHGHTTVSSTPQAQIGWKSPANPENNVLLILVTARERARAHSSSAAAWSRWRIKTMLKGGCARASRHWRQQASVTPIRRWQGAQAQEKACCHSPHQRQQSSPQTTKQPAYYCCSIDIGCKQKPTRHWTSTAAAAA